MNNRRLKGSTIVIPFVYGTQAIPLTIRQKEDAGKGHTHKWTVFVRGLNGEDLSFLFRRVTFQLHHTYDIPTRTVEQAPYEVSETGWGEFEITIKLIFTPACKENSLTLFHSLKLHPLDDPLQGTWQKGKTVYYFQYDELVFNDPYESFYQVFRKQPAIEKPQKKTLAMPYSYEKELEEVDKLEEIKERLQRQLTLFQSKIRSFESRSTKDRHH
ncbi:NuA4 histone H4 acetyltransferase complex and the SWR1 complex subunit [Entomophthora muscae]|uniref:NuA4 histone H4 acetyltransferase complex and the SWR1 complex subunit n=1 Tax=Entomophthora muscae TaxID=34485 RepID=A0ACC2RM15_9FUNG|nr:NuA4 histone H4 acetyltransferase complex and the SWR1 complex subunit [Entomophthora muscae]